MPANEMSRTTWKVRVQMKLDSKKLCKLVNGDKTRPREDGATKTPREEKNMVAMALMIHHLGLESSLTSPTTIRPPQCGAFS